MCGRIRSGEGWFPLLTNGHTGAESLSFAGKAGDSAGTGRARLQPSRTSTGPIGLSSAGASLHRALTGQRASARQEPRSTERGRHSSKRIGDQPSTSFSQSQSQSPSHSHVPVETGKSSGVGGAVVFPCRWGEAPAEPNLDWPNRPQLGRSLAPPNLDWATGLSSAGLSLHRARAGGVRLVPIWG